MNPTVKEYLRKIQYILIASLGFMPFSLILFALAAPELMLQCWLFPLCCTALSALSLFIRGKWRILYGLAGCLLLAGLTAWVIILHTNFFLLAAPVVYFIQLIIALQLAGFGPDEEPSSVVAWVCLAIHICGQIGRFIAHIFGTPVLDPIETPLTLTFLGFILLTMLDMNRSSLQNASMGQQKPSAVVRRRNTMLVLGLFSVILLVSFIPGIIAGLTQFWNWIANGVESGFNALAGLMHSEEKLSYETIPIEGAIIDVGKVTPGQDKTNPSMIILEKVLKIVAGLIALVLLSLLLWQIGKRLLKLLIRFSFKFGHLATSVSEDYEDEITDTRDTNPGDATSIRHRRRIPRVDTKNLSPDQQIRHRYLVLLFKHPEWSAGRTARENLPTDAVSLYEQARYSQHAVSPEDAFRFSENTKRV